MRGFHPHAWSGDGGAQTLHGFVFTQVARLGHGQMHFSDFPPQEIQHLGGAEQTALARQHVAALRRVANVMAHHALHRDGRFM